MPPGKFRKVVGKLVTDVSVRVIVYAHYFISHHNLALLTLLLKPHFLYSLTVKPLFFTN